MAINLYDILQKVLNESVNPSDIDKAIQNRNYVEIYYDDDINASDSEKKDRPNGYNPKGFRLIQPYAYGLSKAGNEVIRAFQTTQNTRRGTPKWKMFRVDRITKWKPRKQTFSLTPKQMGFITQDFNENGDKSMSSIYSIAKFDIDKNDTLAVQREKTKALKNAPKQAVSHLQGELPAASMQRKYDALKRKGKKAQIIQKNLQQNSNEPQKDYWSDYDKAEQELMNMNKIGPNNNDYDNDYDDTLYGPDFDSMIKQQKNNNNKN